MAQASPGPNVPAPMIPTNALVMASNKSLTDKHFRKATVEIIDSNVYVMPLDCTVTDGKLDRGVPVAVEVLPEDGKQTIHVRPLVSQ